MERADKHGFLEAGRCTMSLLASAACQRYRGASSRCRPGVCGAYDGCVAARLSNHRTPMSAGCATQP